MNLNKLAEDLASLLEVTLDAAARRETIKDWLLANKDDVLLMYEDENKPIVENLAAPSDLAVGDYVFASRRADCHPCEPWATGHIAEIGPDYVVLRDVPPQRYRHAMRITFEQGDRIGREFPIMEKSNYPLEYRQVAQVFGALPQN